jgi:undecaprenyl pyrophosphate synthase
MIHIRRFVDKVSNLEAKKTKDVILPIAEARGLRDEIAKLLSDLVEETDKKNKKEEVIKVEIKGGSFK